MNAQNVAEEIMPQRKIRKIIEKRCKQRNIVNIVKSIRFIRRLSRRSVAQLVEHRSPKPRVGGSSPSGPATNYE